MTPPELVALFLTPLEAAAVTYMVTGSVASAIYGEPRFTRDVDLVLSIAPADARRIVAAFPAPAYYCPDAETINAELCRSDGGHFNVIHGESGLRADCYPAGDVPLYQWGLAGRRRLRIGDRSIWVATPEYVILMKLEFRRMGGGEKHLDDISAILRVTGADVDRSVISEWSARLGCDAEWREAQHRTP